MAKTKGPLFSQEAHGSLAKTLNYSRRRSGSQCRTHHKPTGIPSASQRSQRRLTEFLVAQWQTMSAGDKATWAANAAASKFNLSGYHYFLRSAQRDLATHTGLYGYWSCNEIIGGKVLDLSGRGNHGTLQPDYPSNAPSLVPSKFSRYGNALHYDGVDDYVNMGHPADLDFITTMSFSAFFTFRVPSLSEDFLLHKHVWDGGGYGIKVLSDGAIRFVDREDTWDRSVYSKVKISTNTWYDICVTYNNEFIKIYFNGVPSAVTGQGTPVFANAIVEDFELSHSGGWGELLGELDEVCYYKREVSAAEIAARQKFAARNV